MKLTFDQAVNMTWRGYDLVGAAGTVFRLPDSMSALVTSELTRVGNASNPGLTPTVQADEESGTIHTLSAILLFSDSVQKHIFDIPAGATLLGFQCQVAVVSNASSTAAISIGSTSSGAEYLARLDAKTLVNAIPSSGLLCGALSALSASVVNPVWAKYTDAGTPASAGTFYITALYTIA